MENNGLIEIKNATIVNEGRIYTGNVYIKNDIIFKIVPSNSVLRSPFSVQ